jgi:hypothetical protein
MNTNSPKALLGAVYALIVLTALPGCSQEKRATVEVILHGPAIIKAPFKDDGSDGITVFVPRDNDKQHEMVPPDMVHRDQPKNSSCKVTFSIKLVGVDSYHGRPTFPSLSPFQPPPVEPISFRVPVTWKPTGDPFISMAFPSAISVGFLKPLKSARFESGRIANIPLTEILNFQTTDIRAVRLVITRVTECGANKPSTEVNEYRPMTCNEVQKQYQQEYEKQDKKQDRTYSGKKDARPYLWEKLESCTADTFVYLLGVGVPSPKSKEEEWKAYAHGIAFFNDSLLPAIFGTPDQVPRERRLISLSDQETPSLINSPVYEQGLPRLLQADFRYQSPRPRLIPVASTENCSAPGAIVSVR